MHNLSGGTIEEFSLDLAAGEVVGVTGLIGSGYDEIPYLIYGARAARGGTLDIGGRGVELSDIKPRDAIRHGVVLVPADRAQCGRYRTSARLRQYHNAHACFAVRTMDVAPARDDR